jgi:hypothetical protein
MRLKFQEQRELKLVSQIIPIRKTIMSLSKQITMCIIALLLWGGLIAHANDSFFPYFRGSHFLLVSGKSKIKLVPAIRQEFNVYIPSVPKNFMNKDIYLIGVDGKSYKLAFSSRVINQYKNIDWGFGCNDAIKLTAKKAISDGFLVAFGVPKNLKWYSVKELDNKESKANNDGKSSDFISDDGIYGKSQQIIYQSEAIKGQIVFTRYRKLTVPGELSDDKYFKESIDIIDQDLTSNIIESFEPSEGFPKSEELNHPIGPIIGILQYQGSDIWIVSKARRYEGQGFSIIRYRRSGKLSTQDYQCIITGVL